jgi:ribosomal protein S18 acetylase RimI-like enzyme
VFDFCRSTWPGYGDFIPRAWSRWIGDPAGRFIVAELNSIPVGIAKISDFGGGEVWLEGLRVDARYRGRGIADAVNLEVLQTLKRMKPRRVRFCTGLTNRASRRLGQKYGFDIAARFRYYWAKPRRGTPRGAVAGRADAASVYDFVTGSRFMKMSSGLISEGWVFREFSRSLLRRYISRGSVMILKAGGEIRGAGIYPREENENALVLGFVDGNEPAIKMLARNCRYLAKAGGYAECSVVVPSRQFPRVIDDAGYARKDSIGQVVFEYSGKGLR